MDSSTVERLRRLADFLRPVPAELAAAIALCELAAALPPGEAERRLMQPAEEPCDCGGWCVSCQGRRARSRG